jgi:hypothetical protein
MNAVAADVPRDRNQVSLFLALSVRPVITMSGNRRLASRGELSATRPLLLSPRENA